VLRRDFESCARFELGKRVEEIRCPTLLICGDEDVMVPGQSSRELAAGLLRGKLEMISGAGHMVMCEKPTTVAGLIEKELARAN
jgi:pimeloyl-ACP methyl ester carboxylesterase